MTYQLLLTTLGQQKLAAAASAGAQPVRITEFAVGQGVNVDFSKRLDQQVLVSKRYQGKVESVASTAVSGQYEITCIVPQDQGGWAIREIGLIDSAGDLIWVGQVPEVQKPVSSSTAAVDYRIKAVISIDNPNVNLVIDANVVTATQAWVANNFVSNPRFAQFLDLAFPFGYPYWTHSKSNPKPLFDAMFGFETHWRRLEGVGLVAVKDGDAYIGQPMLTLGQVGNTELATTGRPHAYPIHTSYLFERYDPSTVVETVWKVVANKTSINEGDAVRFTVTANNLPDGQILSWSVKEGALNSSSNDISNPEKTESDTVILKNGQAIINFITTPDDNKEEPQKHVRLVIGAPANLSLNVPITDAGHNETAVHITQSTTSGLALDEYYRQQSGSYPTATDKIRFIVDAGVDIIAPDTNTPAIVDGSRWPLGSEIIIENRGRILGRGGNGGRSAYQFKAWDSNGDMIYATNKSVYRSPEKGGNGGTSIKSLTRAILVENHSVIAGGGGGGGGLGAYRTAGTYNFVVGGGGTGGGAPFGLRSPNEATYTMYLQDQAVTDKKLPMPDDGKFYYVLFQRVAGSLANAQGTDADSYYDSSYTAANIDETRAIYVEAVVGQNKRATGNFETYRIGGGTGLPYNQTAFNTSYILNMSQDAKLDSAGIGGTNISPAVASGWAASTSGGFYDEGYDPTVNKGGNGGAFGENGQDGVFENFFYKSNNTESPMIETTSDNTTWYIPSAQGGLAGYIKEGSVTITNYSNGVTKGR
ncbi:phage tail-collar fiber domain-containing protein [Psychrobacter alimentarius]|uniref:phage tail-collar fiber domain-containing protein n=1 Tax=Psychrobacter alimentarius TaxID=261164 RepID=UPI003FD05A82